jgi:ATP/ADP translocase
MAAPTVGTNAAAEESQWRPLLWVAALAFLVLFSYGLSRSAIDALLQADNGKDATKYAYALVALGVTIVVPIYSRAASKFALGNVMAMSAVATASVLAMLLIARGFRIPYATYVLYIWKDVYVVVLVELIWTLANSAFKSNTARWAYGFFCVAGTCGDMSGSFLSGKLAHSVGSAELLWLVVPTMAAVAVVGIAAAKASGWPHPSGKNAIHGLISVVRNSRSIQLLLALVAVIQIVTTLIDFTYLTTTYESYPDLDDRTEIFSQVSMTISLISLILQAFSGAIVTIIGIRALIVALPIILGAAALYASLHPTFVGLAVLKIVNKSLDYSLFRTSKELLYRPLTYAERTQGKAAVDIFGYRAAKGGASGLLVGLSGLAALVTVATAIGIGLWLVLVVFLAQRFTPEESTAAK